jgi:hypothetical protein
MVGVPEMTLMVVAVVLAAGFSVMPLGSEPEKRFHVSGPVPAELI